MEGPDDDDEAQAIAKVFRERQKDRTLVFSSLNNAADATDVDDEAFSFVIAADTQLGMLYRNLREPFIEIEYSEKAIDAINQLQPRPLFCCVCGDLVDMSADIFAGLPKRDNDKNDVWTVPECDALQERQMKAFAKTWNDQLHPDICLVCVCGNHDVGNRPTATSIQRYTDQFGDDYLSFWVRGTLHIVLNSSIIAHPDAARNHAAAQETWLRQQLQDHAHHARHVFVYSHHPWFLYNVDEDESALTGKICDFPKHWPVWEGGFPESYFPIPREKRRPFMKLFQDYGVTACFAGHFHQNVVSTVPETGMHMITTGPLSVVLPSNGNTKGKEPFELGFRVVKVGPEKTDFSHEYVSIE